MKRKRHRYVNLLGGPRHNKLGLIFMRFLKDLAFQLIKFMTCKHVSSLPKTFQYTHFSSCYPSKKGEALCLLGINSVKETFKRSKWGSEHRLCQRGYPLTLVKEILTEIKFTDIKEALRNETNKRDFTVCYNLQSGHTESQKDSHETLARHSTAT